MPSSFNNYLRQVILLGVIIALALLLLNQLYIFLPGFLGAITLYILSREWYFRLTQQKKWRKGWTALLFIAGYVIVIGLPVYLAISLMAPKINIVFHNSQEVIQGLKTFSEKIKEYTGYALFTDQTVKSLQNAASDFIPAFLNSTGIIISNLGMLFFSFYFLLISGKEIEKLLDQFIPLHPENVGKLASETKNLVRANAIGIPVISIVQGLTAAIGYLVFGIADWGLWGFVTGVFAFFPIIGTMIIWVPLVIYLYSSGHEWQSIGLLLYSLLITGNVDYVARLSLMKRIGDVHPIITILGVIVGLKLFGFMGLIFGPLLISYFLILIKIYINEFATDLTTKGKH